jgi:hypothetical protein
MMFEKMHEGDLHLMLMAKWCQEVTPDTTVKCLQSPIRRETLQITKKRMRYFKQKRLAVWSGMTDDRLTSPSKPGLRLGKKGC